jgi:hypothetical protein
MRGAVNIGRFALRALVEELKGAPAEARKGSGA